MRAVLLSATIGLAVAFAPAAFAKNNGPTLQDQQQAACYGDVQKFCGSAMPDVEKVTTCMKPLKEKVSAKCRALWDVKS